MANKHTVRYGKQPKFANRYPPPTGYALEHKPPVLAVAKIDKLTTRFFLEKAAQLDKNRPKYKRLKKDHTRMIVLRKQHGDELDIEIELKEVAFADLQKQPYDALSYHWGPRDNRNPVFLMDPNATEADTARHEMADVVRTVMIAHPSKELFSQETRMLASPHFMVTDNLYQALSHLRTTEDLNIWIDAICINQEDSDEKVEQIARMNEIYSKAHSVTIWLGPGDDKTRDAIDFVRNTLLVDPERIGELVNSDDNTASWQNLLHLMRSSWFSRRWVIQELALAKQAYVHCGYDVLNWVDLRDAISIFSKDFDVIRDSFKRSKIHDHDWNALGEIEPLHAKKLVDIVSSVFREHRSARGWERQAVQSLEYLVSTLSNYDAGDPRDTINAFRYIAKETWDHSPGQPAQHGDPPLVNYRTSLLEVYVKFVQWVVSNGQGLDIICRRWAIPERQRDELTYKLSYLPSWIQTVHDADRRDTILGERRYGDSFVGSPDNSPYKASGRLSARVSFALVSKQATVQEETTTEGASFETPSIFRPHTPEVVVTEHSTHDHDLASPDHTHDDRVTGQDYKSPPAADAQQSSIFSTFSITNGPKAEGMPKTKHHASWDHLQKHYPSRPPLHIRKISVTTDPRNPSLYNMPEMFADGQRVLKQLEDGIDASLYADGLVVGPIELEYGPAGDGVINHTVLQRLYGENTIDPADRVPDRVWKALVAERGPNGGPLPPLYARACQYALRSLNANQDLNIKRLQEKTKVDFVKTFSKRVEGVIWNRCFFRVVDPDTQNEYLGFGPGEASGSSSDGTGSDLLCILYGCSVPVVLRPYQNRTIETFYQLIGEAYVYGIMDGEAIPIDKDELTRRTQTFRIL
ncbi:hypothetical protein AMS68_007545 [Peltaster fructicola]|uniref:Heterokaryon incompatibility domain-containing protein n=1 Tax=Peltaster fructicola TaxID=286661 RepID=A0A6H0Y5B2_9PEZI|nr:hypothetical protein AMS68_007545 [Peltaster fructicola]